MLVGIILLLILILATSFFVASEFALVSVRRTRIEQLAGQGNATARQVKFAIEHLQDYIAATQVGITMAALGLGAWGESVVSGIVLPVLQSFLPEEVVRGIVSVHGIAFVIGYLIVTIMEIVFGEVVPKIIARQNSERAVFFIIRPLNFFAFIFRPLIWVINTMSNAVLRLIHVRQMDEHDNVHSPEELEILVRSSRQAGLLEEEEERIIRRVFDLGDLSARQVMLPRTEIVGVPVGASLSQVVRIIEKERHSRFPVYESNLDHIVGVLRVKDLFLSLARQVDANPDRPLGSLNEHFSVRALMRKILSVPESLNVNDLLTRMQQEGIHMAVVVDEYGGTSGIVTLEDVVEEIVGDLRDEFEGEGEAEPPDIVETPEGTLVNGLTPIDDLNETLGLRIETEADTVGGYVFDRLGRRPELGDEVSVDGYIMRVEELDGLRIAGVRMLSRQEAESDGTSAEDE